ncbi:MAG TPA: hypothetical protein VF294_14950 [Polyangiaceae bacterium]
MNGRAVQNHDDALATQLTAADEDLRFRFHPRGLWPGCLLFVAAIGFLVWLLRRTRASDS